ALRISMEEQRRVQEAEISRPNGTGSGTVLAGGTEGTGTDDPAMRQSLAFFLGDQNDMDVTRLTEDEQIALAIKMSMAPGAADTTNSADIEMKDKEESTISPPATASTAMETNQPEITRTKIEEEEDNFAASLNDPQFLRDVLKDLPGVDVDSDAVRAALEQVQTTSTKPKESDAKKKDEAGKK
ncbi:unnamed protein product, partial [Didymodactylos carnosus]